MFACGVGKDMTKGFVPPAASFIGLLEAFAEKCKERKMFKKVRDWNSKYRVKQESIDSGERLYDYSQFQEHYETIAFSLQSLDRFDQVLPIL